MLRTGHRWDVGDGVGLGWREEHLEVMEVFFAFKGLLASKLLLIALKNIPHDGRTIFQNKMLVFIRRHRLCSANNSLSLSTIWPLVGKR